MTGGTFAKRVAELSAALCVQSAKEYYEQALMQELKKNQELQEYLRLLENKMHRPKREDAADKQVSNSVTAGFCPRGFSS